MILSRLESFAALIEHYWLGRTFVNCDAAMALAGLLS